MFFQSKIQTDKGYRRQLRRQRRYRYRSRQEDSALALRFAVLISHTNGWLLIIFTNVLMIDVNVIKS